MPRPRRSHLLFALLLVSALTVALVALLPRIVERTRRDQRAQNSPASSPTTPSSTGDARQAQLGAAYGKLPLSFEVNKGQTAGEVKFLSRGQGYNLFLTGTEAVLSLQSKERATRSDARKNSGSSSRAESTGQAVLRMKLVGANAEAEAAGVDELPGRSNYFIGDDPAKWQTDVAHYARVRYEEVYPGVDLVYYGTNQRQLEYDFHIAPGVNPTGIKLAFDGAQRIKVNKRGALVLKVEGGEVEQHKPIIYQEIDGERKEIAGRYVVGNNREVGFEVGEYDATRPLVIDPVLSYSTYLGGTGNDSGNSIAVDSTGAVYIAGETFSTNFPSASPVPGPSPLPPGNVFVTKINPAGSGIIYSAYIGGSDASDVALGIAVDSSNTAYITGRTESSDYPVTANRFQSSRSDGADAFVTRLNAAGNGLQYSSYLGGQGEFQNLDEGHAIAADSAGNAYVTGTTLSPDLPTSAGAYDTSHNESRDVFVGKFDTNAPAVASCPPDNPMCSRVYLTYIGGGSGEEGNGIAIDSSGSAYITGETSSAGFPVANPLPESGSSLRGGSDAFVTKLNPTGSALIYSTFLGGSATDQGRAIALDSAGNAYVTGSTGSSDFPMMNEAFAFGGAADAFVTKLNAAGSALIYSTFLGGAANDAGRGIDVDEVGNAYITGSTTSGNFPTDNAIQSAFGGGTCGQTATAPTAPCEDAFVTKIQPTGVALAYSTYLGGNSSDTGNGIAVGSSGTAYIAGNANSSGFSTQNAFQVNKSEGQDAFVARINTSVDLFVAQSAPDTATVNSEFTYTITITNNGPDVATGVTLTDMLPDNTTYGSATPSQGSCSQTNNTVQCALGALDINASATVEIVVTPTATGTITNTAEVIAFESESNGEDNSTTEQTTVNGANILTVNTKADGNDGACNSNNCTLREAINAANSAAGTQTINFNIPAESSPFTINVGVNPVQGGTALGALPVITDPVIIDGTTQPGFAGAPIIELNGSSAGSSTTFGTNGLNITAGNSTVRGLVINRFSGRGVVLQTGGGNVVEGNNIGTNAGGNTDLANGQDGIQILNSPNNLIGGTTPAARNVISGNSTTGIRIEGAATTGNRVFGNYIGTNAAGTADLGNSNFGVWILSASNNQIGGGDAGARNIISGNDSSGVNIEGNANGTASGNSVQGNYIGTDVSGTLDLGNSIRGVAIQRAVDNNIIGGLTATPGTGLGNIISGNNAQGIFIGDALAGTTVQGNLIGLQAGGTQILRNGTIGIFILRSPGNTVGGANVQARNVITGNLQGGILISEDQSDNNTVAGNIIGLDINGTTDPDSATGTTYGVSLSSRADNNTIGGLASTAGTAPGNIISGNSGNGVRIEGQGFTGTARNVVQGNLIGTDVTGSVARGNGGSGVLVTGIAGNNRIGGTAAGARNVISGNGGNGVEFTTGVAAINFVEGNLIGTTASGTAALANAGAGIRISASGRIVVGGATSAHRNIISGNGGLGVEIVGAAATANSIQGNYIGTDITGAADLGNGTGGVSIAAANNTIGGLTATPGTAPGNVISGNNGSVNTGNGILLTAGSSATLVQGNLIGTNAAGTAAIPNFDNGINIGSSANNTIGGASVQARNVISGNGGDGIRFGNTGSTGNVFRNNFIGTALNGTDALGNGGHGIFAVSFFANSADTIANTTIGGSGAGNVIAHNGGDGIYLDSGTNHGISSNSIFANAGLGIDLRSNNVTPNDSSDGDAGANRLQNFPVLTSATTNGNGVATVSVALNSTPNTNFTVELFVNSACDTSGNGEGQTFGNRNPSVTTDANGNASLTLDVSATAGQLITATATDSDNNTSEFSPCAQVLTAYTISGRIREGDNPIEGVTVTLSGSQTATTMTDGEGDYRFTGLTAGGNYTVTPSGAGRTFDPPSASFEALESDRIADFQTSIPTSFTVSNTNDIGAGSLRQAIRDANAASGSQTILFNIPTSDPGFSNGVFTIRTTQGRLDSLTDNGTIIDGTTQTVFTGDTNAQGPEIVLDGGGASPEGFFIAADDCVVRGFVINNFRAAGVGIYGSFANDNSANGNKVEGCYIGTNATGTSAAGNDAGVTLFRASNNVIGGVTEGTRNVISGNRFGIEIRGETNANLVQGNFIGTNASGTTALGNTQDGISINDDSANSTIGGTTPAARNVISGNASGSGINISAAATRNAVQGNYIGTDVSGLAPLGNRTGVTVSGEASGNSIGGRANGAGNIIAYSQATATAGVFIFSGTNNTILSNSIYENGGMGIALGDDGVIPNDAGDADQGANDLQNFPVLTAANRTGTSNLNVQGTLNSTPDTLFLIQFFTDRADAASAVEGRRLIGEEEVRTDANGNVTFNKTLEEAAVPVGDFVTATATVIQDPTFGSTSEFSAPLAVSGDCVAPPAGMTAWYPGDGNANDIQGNNEGTLIDGTTFAAGKVGQAFNFDGGFNAVSFGNSVGDFGTSDFSVDFWIKPNSAHQGEVLGNRTDCSNGNFFSVRSRASGGLTVEVDNGGSGYIAIDSDTNVSDGDFHHIAIVRQGTTLSLYIDGTLDASRTADDGAVANINNDNDFIAGRGSCGQFGQSNFAGQLDEIEIFNGTALSPGDIRSVFLAGTAGKCKNPGLTISGRVTEESNGAGVSDASVRLFFGGQSRTTTTNQDGFYSFDNLLAGETYEVFPVESEYIFTPQSRMFANLSANQTADFTGRLFLTISGNIFNQINQDGLGISGVTVTLSGDSQASIVTGANGYFEFTQLPRGTYTVTPSRSGYEFNPPSRTFDDLQASERGIIFTTQSAQFFTVSGQVADANGAPIVNANVALYGLREAVTRTNADGFYSFSNLQDGESYRVTVSKAVLVFTPQVGETGALTGNTTVNFTASPAVGLITRIAFERSEGGFTTDIFIINADGTGETNLTSNTADFTDSSPAWSPDGARLVFSSNRNFSRDLYTMNADGTGVVQLTNTPDEAESEPAWSPATNALTSNKIVFVLNAEDEEVNQVVPGIFVINTDGTNRRRLTSNGFAFDFNPTWSPDGTKVAFTRFAFTENGESSEDIYVITNAVQCVNDSEVACTVQPLTDIDSNDSDSESLRASEPAWSPNGGSIAFTVTRQTPCTLFECNFTSDIFVMAADGSSIPQNVTRNPPSSTFIQARSSNPTWSPDGNKIGFQNGVNSDHFEVFAINPDGSGLVQITTGLANDNFTQGSTAPAWQPIQARQVDLALRLNVFDTPEPLRVGDEFKYGITIDNIQPTPSSTPEAANVVVTDALPAGVTFVSATTSRGECSEAQGTVTCNLGTLPALASETINITVRAAQTGTFTNTATVTTSDTDINTANNSDSEAVTIEAANPFIVTNTNDNGAGSLRQAILEANATAGVQTISFNIGNGGTQTIALTSVLPTITDPVIIDGATQPDGAAGAPLIELNGSTAGGAGLDITAGGSTVRGLVINRFSRMGIELRTNGGNTIEGNYIGTDAAGTVAAGNQEAGIAINSGSNGNTIANNIISGNGAHGVDIYISANTNTLRGNFIGTNATGASLGNGGHGVLLNSASGNIIGGANTAGNVIAFNGGSGVSIGNFFGSGSVNNTIQGNSIFNNGALGIDLEGGIQSNRVTANDAGDADTGINNLQNFPVITSAVNANGTTTIQGTLNSTPNTIFRLEFFANAACDASGNGEGQFTRGTTSVTTDANGNANFSHVTTGSISEVITATATDAAGNTSEFSPCSQVTAQTYTISGRLTDASSGNGLANTNVTLRTFTPPDQVGNVTIQTDENGNYSFSGLTGGNNEYTITPSRNGFTFTPQTQSFSNLTANQTADFTATEQPSNRAPVAVADSYSVNQGQTLVVDRERAVGDSISYQSATLGGVGTGGGFSLGSSQFLGSRFTVERTTQVTRVGGHLVGTGTFFAVILRLSGPGALPSGNPFDDTVVASTTFTPPNPSADFLTPLSATLEPGTYALVFGSGQFGASGSGAMPSNNPDLPGARESYFFRSGGNNNGAAWNNGGFSGTRFVVSGRDIAGVLDNDTDADGDTLSAAVVNPPSNGSLTLNANGTFTYTPNANFSGTDSFTYKANDGTADSNVATATISVVAGRADLSVSVTDSPDPVTVGNDLTYTTTITNNGPNAATNVRLTSAVPQNSQFVSVDSENCQEANGTITCTFGNLASGASIVVHTVVRPLPAGTINVSASVTANESDSNTNNNSDTESTTVQAATFTISGRVLDASGAGISDATVTLGGEQTGTTVTDTAGFYSFANLAAGGTYTVTPSRANLTFTPASRTFENLSQNQTGDFVAQAVPMADLAITNTDSPDPVATDSNLTYTLTVTNNGLATATGTTVTDTLPSNVTFVSASSTQGTCQGTDNSVSCNLGDLANGATATVTLIVRPNAAGTLTNTASVFSNVADPNGENNSASAQTTVTGSGNVNPNNTVTLTGGGIGGSRVFIQNFNSGRIVDFPAGTRLSVLDANLGNQGDAFDGALEMAVGGALFSAPNPSTLNGNIFSAGPVSLSGLNVSQQYYAAQESGTIRALSSFQNLSQSPITVPVDFLIEIGSNGSTVTVTTSSGDNIFTLDDRYVITDDSLTGGDPTITSVFYGPGSPALRPSAVFQSGPGRHGGSREVLRATYNLTVPVGATRRLLLFSQLNRTAEEARTNAPAFFDANPAVGGDLLGGLTADQLAEVVNFNFGEAPPIPGTLQFGAASFNVAENVAENGGAATITVTRTNGSNGAVSVNFATSDGTATADSDYTPASGTLNFADGETSQTFTVPIFDDNIFENGETINLSLANPTGGASLGSQSAAVLNITDNDSAPSLSISDATLTEGNTGTTNAVFTVSLSAASGLPITVNVSTENGTATTPSDYAAVSGTLTFAPGTTVQTISVPVVGDSAVEDDETFFVNLNGAENATLADNRGIGTITNDDAEPGTLQFIAPNYTVAEDGGTATITVARSGGANGVVAVNYATGNGTATAGSDYTAQSGTLTFADGETTKTFTVPVSDDAVSEPSETVNLTLSNPAGGASLGSQSTAVLTITDNEGVPSISINDVTLAEGNTDTTGAVFTVTLSTPSSQVVTVNFTTANGTATAGSDYTAASGTLTIPAGATAATITVPVIGDTVVEGDETFFVNLSGAENAAISDNQGVGTIINDDAEPGALQFSAPNYSVSEDGATATITVVRSGGTNGTVTVSYTTGGGTATAGTDYTAQAGTLTFGEGETEKSFTIPVADDAVDEVDETVNLTLSNPTGGATLGAQNASVLTIQDNDSPPSISINDVTVTEGDTGTQDLIFTVSLSALSGQNISVNFATADGAATAGADYNAASGTVTIPAGAISATIVVPIRGDTADEPNETFTVNLTSPANATIANGQGTGTIIDNDEPEPPPTFTVAGRVVDANGIGISGVTMTLTEVNGGNSTIVTDANGSYSFTNAASGRDYTLTPSRTSFEFTPSNRAIANLSGDRTTENFTSDSRRSVETPAGTNVTTTVEGNSITFANVTSAGMTTLTDIDPNAQGALPTGYAVLNEEAAIDITTTATTEGPITVCAQVPEINDPALFAQLRILHGENGVLVDRTILAPDSPAPNFTTRTICARVNSLSPFVLALVQTGAINGRITTSNGAGIGNVAITLTGTQTGVVTTDANGNYAFVNLIGGGNYTVTPSLANFTFAPSSLSFNNLGGTQTANFTGTLVNYRVGGRIADAGGNPLGGVTITLSGAQTETTVTDANGNYLFATVAAAANYTVTPTANNFTFTPARRDFTNLNSDQTANFTGAAQPTSPPVPPPSDNFGDPNQSRQIFNLGTVTQNAAAFDPNVSVIVQNGQLEITPREGADAASFNGFVSIAPLDLTVTPTVSVEIKQVTNGEGAQTGFAVGNDNDNFYRFFVGENETPQAISAKSGARTKQTGAQTLTFQVVLNGQPFSTGITYDPVQHRFWRFRNDAVALKMNFETSPDSLVWTLQFSSDLSARGAKALASELSAGTLRRTANPGKAIFDNYAVSDVTTVAFASATTSVAENARTATVTVTRRGNVESSSAISFATSDGTATAGSDYTPVSGTLSFAPGELSKNIEIAILDDSVEEADETISVTLRDPIGSALGAPLALALTILSDDGRTNPIDDARFFVRQHYLDFLNREPDLPGLEHWTREITMCSEAANRLPGETEARCIDRKRVNTSGAFFLSEEFQGTGFFVYRIYNTSFGRQPLLAEWRPDTLQVASGIVVNNGLARDVIERNKRVFAAQLVERPEFKQRFDSLTEADYVDALYRNAGVTPSSNERAALILNLLTNRDTRAGVLLRIAENKALIDREFNPAFVLMEYFGYLRRDPDAEGYEFWLAKLNRFGNFVDAEMVRAFIVSAEYRGRFGRP